MVEEGLTEFHMEKHNILTGNTIFGLKMIPFIGIFLIYEDAQGTLQEVPGMSSELTDITIAYLELRREILEFKKEVFNEEVERKNLENYLE